MTRSNNSPPVDTATENQPPFSPGSSVITAICFLILAADAIMLTYLL